MLSLQACTDHRPALKRFGDEIFPLWGGLFEPKPRIFWDSKEQLFLGAIFDPKNVFPRDVTLYSICSASNILRHIFCGID